MDEDLVPLPIGKAEVLREGKGIVILAYGTCVKSAVAAADLLEGEGAHPMVINARFAKPLDTALLDELMEKGPLVLTIEENALAGGFGSAVLEHLAVKGYEAKRIKCLGIPDRYVSHAPQADLIAEVGLTPEHIAKTALDMLKSQKRLARSTMGSGA
jgi:1-deoxy-D-xylulose-5-phosphate synthase